MGPAATPDQLARIRRYVDVGSAEGARLVCGGRRPSAPPDLARGWFFEPTSVIRFQDEEDAVRLANDSRYGLAAGVWTLAIRPAHRMARDLEAGTIWINSYRAASFAAPRGGYKESGHGRENGIDVIHEYTQVKNVWVEPSGATADPFKVR